MEIAEKNQENNENKLSFFINICLDVENKIINIKEINNSIQKCKNFSDEKINFIPEDNKTIEQFLEKIKHFGEIQINNFFEEINNPWTTERFKYEDVFYYTLKEDNYVAEKTEDNSFIHLIKSSYQLKKDKIYKLIFEVNFKGGDFDIGFADFSKTTMVAKLTSSENFVAITNKGLIINEKNINNKVKTENGKKYKFIIDMKNKNFSLSIDEIKIGDFNFDFQDNVFAQASIRNLGNSVRIKTYEK